MGHRINAPFTTNGTLEGHSGSGQCACPTTPVSTVAANADGASNGTPNSLAIRSSVSRAKAVTRPDSIMLTADC